MPARAPRSDAPPAHESSACKEVRQSASDARERYEWKALLAASSRASCWRSRSDALRLRVKALMELGQFTECADAVARDKTRDAELARFGELCRRRLAGPA
ncbi:MAG: hypothetical protein IAG13_11915 [Deltaproteobacteria bacterium]|nr:hypothetical protein [Nannocystaceae bacterium]